MSKMLASRLARLTIQKNFSFSNFTPKSVVSRTITTSKKNREATTATTTVTEAATTKVNSNWQSYGFGLTEHTDKIHMHLTFFFGVTITLVMMSFYVAYAPNTVDWEQREAYLELRRREKLGLPLIDRNFIDPACVTLPDDADLAEEEIIL